MGTTGLMLAASNNHLEVVDYLIYSGVNIDTQNKVPFLWIEPFPFSHSFFETFFWLFKENRILNSSNVFRLRTKKQKESEISLGLNFFSRGG